MQSLAPGWQGHMVWSFLSDGVLEVKAGGAVPRVRVSCCICSSQASLDEHNKDEERMSHCCYFLSVQSPVVQLRLA